MNGQGDGLQGPVEAGELDVTAQAALQELRNLRSELLARAESVGRLEKKLRGLLKESSHDRDA